MRAFTPQALNPFARIAVSIGLTLAYLFLSIAIFSPLHVHHNSDGVEHCSLNHFEQLISKTASSIALLLVLLWTAWTLSVESLQVLPLGFTPTLPARAPPSLFAA